ncbi:Hypothetical protein FKW44_013407 [Caligus rogercresseyi]|uniref:Uncharacterized protein n=1 Tax=Caligus rogercresseyi TaxID=217165 RepID=A0A7T8KAX5_CALRO|nr:Hypothetical protein FKW44_013407 [Caligus rogercresseyi]
MPSTNVSVQVPRRSRAVEVWHPPGQNCLTRGVVLMKIEFQRDQDWRPGCGGPNR